MILKIPERIKDIRDKNGLTQEELARKMSITRSSVNAWEMGISMPSPENLVRLSDIFNVSTDYILGVDNRETVSIDNLSDEEKKIVYELVKILKKKK